MQKTLLYFIILVVLGLGIYFFIFSNNNSSPYSTAEAGFTVKDTSAVSKIYLVANDGESILLQRTDSGWMVNKQYKVLRGSLTALLGTLRAQVPLYPVPKSAYDNVVKELSTDGVKVEVYDKEGKKTNVFYVGGSAVNNSGTNMMMENAHTPFVVQIQGFTGYLTSRYSTKLRDWRDRTIFNIPPEEIKSISVQYANNPLNSFSLVKQDTNIKVIADPKISNSLDGFNASRAKIYAGYFKNINSEGYLNNLEGLNETIRTAPKQSSIDVEGIHGQHEHADIYWMAINRRSKNQTVSNPDVPDDYDADRLYAVINNGTDTVLIQQHVFKPIFRKAFEFFQNGDTTNYIQPHPRNVIMHKQQ